MARYTVDQFRAAMNVQPEVVRVEIDWNSTPSVTVVDKANELCARWVDVTALDALDLICALYRDRAESRDFYLVVDASGIGYPFAYELASIAEFRHKVSVVPWNHR